MSDILSAMLAQYETNTNAKSFTQRKEVDLNKYYTTHLKDGVATKTDRIRVLPPKKAGTSPFTEVWVHTIQVEGQWRKFICPKHEKDEACPFCEAREALLANGTETDKELAKKYAPKKMYVARVIDRQFEADGPKFWRFAHDWRKTGILDKIQALLPITGDFSNPETGADFFITIARDQNKRPVVQAVLPAASTPLNADAELAKSWIENPETWEDVYAIKGYDYLEIIVKGGTPVWDKEAKKYVDKSSEEGGDGSESELVIGGGSATLTTSTPAPTSAAITGSEEEEDDLPF